MRQTTHILFAMLLLIGQAPLDRALAVDRPRPIDAPSSLGGSSEDGGIVRSPPRDTGDADAKFWQHPSDAQQAQSVAELKAFAESAAKTVKRPLRLNESRDFLVYSDLTESEAAHCSSLLERTYARLCELFTLDKARNIWRGKALVFIFARIEDYRLYERLVENDDPGGSFAITHCFGDGMVHTAYDRYADQGEFEHLLAHESVHGFLHRYKSPARVPSWANEGLADLVASDVVPDAGRMKAVLALSRSELEKHDNSVKDFFTAAHIDGWQYPVAETLTGWMVRQNRAGYFAFIGGVKDGQSWDKSLDTRFKMTPAALVEQYGKALGAANLRAG